MASMVWLSVLWWIYAVLGLLAVLVLPASAYGWLGVAPDPLAGLYAVALGLPWTALLIFVGVTPVPVATLLMAAPILLNLAVFKLIGRSLRRWRSTRRARQSLQRWHGG